MKRPLPDEAVQHGLPAWLEVLRAAEYQIERVPEPDRPAVLDGLRSRGVELPGPGQTWPSIGG